MRWPEGAVRKRVGAGSPSPAATMEYAPGAEDLKVKAVGAPGVSVIEVPGAGERIAASSGEK